MLPAAQAAWHVVKWLKEALGAREVLDLFCGEGTVPAVAQLQGLKATGIEISSKRCRSVPPVSNLLPTTSPSALARLCAPGRPPCYAPSY